MSTNKEDSIAMKDLKSVRKDYSNDQLSEENALSNPTDQLTMWLKEAKESDATDYNAMTLSSISPEGFPQSRIVLCREFTEKGLVFYTNYNSSKAKQILNKNKVCVSFFWKELERQVRITGVARKIDVHISDEYFASRPRASQIGAWASNQSEEIQSREELQMKVKAMEERFDGQEVPRPDFWGGFIIEAQTFEFWQGRPSRLHDRLRYKNLGGDWKMERLAP